MRILLVYPQYPQTFWSFKYALKFISKKASHPPLGLITVAAILPQEWEKRLVDMNVSPLKDEDLLWADYVFMGAMSIQRESARNVIARCRELGKTVVAGGPLFTACPEEFDEVDHLVLNEAEITLPMFLQDAARGHARHVYTTTAWADITTTPVPLRSLLDQKQYASMNVQYSRGCPYDCEFCDITVLYGRVPRTKTSDQVLTELESLYATGWRASVFFVDDNFIGNRVKLKKEILPAIIGWMERKNHPFSLSTEASVNLSDDGELMDLMVQAGFNTVFVGIESPHDESLQECKKTLNRNRDLIQSVKTIQRAGLEVQGGFIVGFDNDPASIFEKLVEFIQASGIVSAMVGLLNAPRGTKLYKRLLEEGRLLHGMSGDNTDFSVNFVPAMNIEVLLNGYRNLVRTLYAPKQYYARVKQFLREYKPLRHQVLRVKPIHIQALLKSIVVLGIVGRERFYYWRLFFWSLFHRPRLFPMAITFSIYGFHFRKIFQQVL
jgi:radical SAM superfamily enzyme YgiQ (UPF0313 family)